MICNVIQWYNGACCGFCDVIIFFSFMFGLLVVDVCGFCGFVEVEVEG